MDGSKVVDTQEHPEPRRTTVDHGGQLLRTPVAPSGDDVLRVLAPLGTAYVRRASPAPLRAAPEPNVALADLPEPAFTACAVEGVVTIDAERRVLWPVQLTCILGVAVALRATRGAIEVIANPQPGGHARAVDQRGRLRLPRGVLRAAGLEPGDRVVIARSGTGERVLLVRADRLGIDVTTAR